MIIIRRNYFSNTMVKKLEEKLTRERIDDFEISDKIPKDVISIDPSNLNDIKIYIPEDLEFSQYGIDDQIRELSRYNRTKVELDRSIYIMTLSSPLNQDQVFKLIKYIIDEEGFCTILDM